MTIITDYGERLANVDPRDIRASGYRHPIFLMESGRINDGRDLAEVFWSPVPPCPENARIAFIGMAPGLEQISNVFETYFAAVLRGNGHNEALQMSMRGGDPRGADRDTLTRCLEEVLIHEYLDLSGAGSLWSGGRDLIHFINILRWPVFVNGRIYSGSRPSLFGQDMLSAIVDRHFISAIERLPQDCLIFPLGETATQAFYSLISRIPGFRRSRLMVGLPHPGPSGRGVAAQFLGEPPNPARAKRLNPKYRKAALDLRARLLEKINEP